MDNTHLLDKYKPVALVTGASSGIGEQFAIHLAGAGFDLVLVARREARLNALAARLESLHGTRTTVLAADLAAPGAVDTVIAATAGLDIGLLVSNAGFGLKGPHHQNDAPTMTDMLMVNCHAPMQLTHAFIPRFLARGSGGIVLTSSVEGLLGFPNSASYSASKAFVNSLAEGLWGELSPRGIDVVAVCPGSTDTEAHALQGVDRAKVSGMMSPASVVQLTLDKLTDGPTFIAGEQNEAMFSAIAAMPRRDALVMLGEAIQQSLLSSN